MVNTSTAFSSNSRQTPKPFFGLGIYTNMTSAEDVIPLSLASSLSDPSARSRSLSCSSLALALPSSCPSLYAAYKVLKLVNIFRKRITTRVRSSSPKNNGAKVRAQFCQEYERQASLEVDRYLGRKIVYPNKKNYPKSSNGHPQPAPIAPTTIPSRTLQSLLKSLNRVVTADGHSLSTVAQRYHLFLSRKSDYKFKRLSFQQLTEVVVVVQDLLASLKQASYIKGHNGARTLCDGNEVLDISLDETDVANLEHLLLCLQDQLLRLLVSKCVGLLQQHLIECQRDQSKHSEEWFFEFPDARHPLSTTWPWSIRPSLAVLWGVCWMFYDNTTEPQFDEQGNMVDVQGNIIVSSRVVRQFLTSRLQQDQEWQRQASYSPIANTQELASQNFGGPFDHMQYSTPRQTGKSAAAQAQPQTAVAPPGRHTSSSASPASESLATTPFCLSHTSAQHQAGAHDQGPHLSFGPVGQDTNYTYTTAAAAAPRSAYAQPGIANVSADWLPQENAATGFEAQDFQDNSYEADSNQWQLPPQSISERQPAAGFGFEPQALPPRKQHPDPPSIRIDTDFSGAPAFQQTPQDIYPHSASVYQQDYAQSYTYNVSNLSPRNPFMTTENQNHVPVSPVSAGNSPSHIAMAEQLTRKRSHSQISRDDPQPESAHSRVNSVGSVPHNSTSPAPDYDSPTRGSRSFKRGDAPTNGNNKYICDFSQDCQGLTFDRKCEWSKHMDKHDRPYRCPHPSCAKLQGFTYSGGLLRHEREVHGKHGGPKAQLMCPHVDCKRHTGKGFTRKENLNEHIRRVHHESKPHPTQPLQMSQDLPYKPENLPNTMAGADELGETPMSRISEAVAQDDLEAALGKRKRSIVEYEAPDDVDDLRQRVKRLHAENAEKDERLRRMELDYQHLQEIVRQLQQTQQHGQQGQAGPG